MWVMKQGPTSTGGARESHGVRLTYASKDEPIYTRVTHTHAHARVYARGINESRQLALAHQRRAKAFYRELPVYLSSARIEARNDDRS